MSKEIWWILRNEMKLLWPAYLLTLAFTFFLGLAASITFGELTDLLSNEESDLGRILLDNILVIFTPCLATIYMSRPYRELRTIREDPFGKRLALYRTMPIPVNILAKSRMWLMLMTLLTLSLAFFGSLTLFLPEVFFLEVSMGQLQLFFLFWFGYALALGACIVYIEFGTNGKVLYLAFFAFAFGAEVLIVTYNMAAGRSVGETVLSWISRSGAWLPLLSLAAGAVTFQVMERVLQNRLARRDYL